MTCRVTFMPSGQTFDANVRSTLFRAVLRARLPLARSCRGVAVCGDCRVTILQGEQNMLPPTADELTLAARMPLRQNERFSCQARIKGPVTITTRYW